MYRLPPKLYLLRHSLYYHAIPVTEPILATPGRQIQHRLYPPSQLHAQREHFLFRSSEYLWWGRGPSSPPCRNRSVLVYPPLSLEHNTTDNPPHSTIPSRRHIRLGQRLRLPHLHNQSSSHPPRPIHLLRMEPRVRTRQVHVRYGYA